MHSCHPSFGMYSADEDLLCAAHAYVACVGLMSFFYQAKLAEMT